MAILFFSSIYPHYYAWWAYFNYYNDDFYSQWWHQLFFTVTEMVSTVLVLHLVDKNNFASPRKIVVIMRCRGFDNTLTSRAASGTRLGS